MPDNAAVDALLFAAAVVALALLALAPAIRARTGPRLSEEVRARRAELLLAALADARTRRDGYADARRLVAEHGRTGRERHQVVRELIDRDWAEARGRAGLALVPAFLRLTSTGWWECSYRRAAQSARAERQPPKPPTVTYLSFRQLVPTGPAGRRSAPSAADRDDGTGGDDGDGSAVVCGPSEQRLRELYVALRADAENILASGLRQDALDRADEVERAVAEPDAKDRWAVVDQVGPLVALDHGSFPLTIMVLKRLLT